MVRDLIREPLLHFAGIGALVFLAHGLVPGPRPEPADTIVVGAARIEEIAARHESVWRRPPTDEERRALVEDLVREEIYYREALALGLDRDDSVVRQRLRQKMEFLADSGADLLLPAPGELEAWFAANGSAYRQEARLALEQVFLGETPEPGIVAKRLNSLRTNPASDPFSAATPSLLPSRIGLTPSGAVDAVFGSGFSERLAGPWDREWVGPVPSAYGMHLVRVLERVPARALPLEEVRDAVLRDWKAAKELEIRERHYERLRERYVVVVAEGATTSTENR